MSTNTATNQQAEEEIEEEVENSDELKTTFMNIVLEILKLDDDYGMESIVFSKGENENINYEDEEYKEEGTVNPLEKNRVRIDFDRLKHQYENSDKSLQEIIDGDFEYIDDIPELERGDTAVVDENPDKDHYTQRNLADAGFEEGDELDVVRAENSAHLASVDANFVPPPNDYAVLVELNEEGNQRDFFYASDFKVQE